MRFIDRFMTFWAMLCLIVGLPLGAIYACWAIYSVTGLFGTFVLVLLFIASLVYAYWE